MSGVRNEVINYPLFGLWEQTNKGDQFVRRLADKHYSRRKVGSSQFMAPGAVLVLKGDACAWGVVDQKFQDHQWKGALVNSLFRNEGPHLSSHLIIEATAITLERFGPRQLITFVEPRAIRSTNPGCCYKIAGWRRIGSTPGGHGRGAKIVFQAPSGERK